MDFLRDYTRKPLFRARKKMDQGLIPRHLIFCIRHHIHGIIGDFSNDFFHLSRDDVFSQEREEEWLSNFGRRDESQMKVKKCL
jgi:hypothetical protein